jgi:hypothetical protein
MFENADTHKEAGVTADPKDSAPTGTAAAAASASTSPGSGTRASGQPASDPPAEKDRLSSGFAKLARDKAAVLERQRAVDARAGELKTWTDLKAKIAADPAAVLELLGADSQAALELVAEAYLKRNSGRTEPTAEDRLAALEAERTRERADRETQATKDREAAQQRAVDAGKEIVRDVVAGEKVAAQFPTINGLGEHEQVFTALSDYVARHKIPSAQVTTDLVLVVAAEVEKALIEEVSGLVSKAPHIAARVATPAKQPAPTGHTTVSGAQGTSSTSLASSEVNGAPPPQPGRRYTREELSKMALAHFASPT